jgi:hypothetical protein
VVDMTGGGCLFLTRYTDVDNSRRLLKCA